MTHLGPNQLATLHQVGTSFAIVVPTPTTRRLVHLGLMVAEADGSCARITPNGLRALADAADAGRIVLFNMDAVRNRAMKSAPHPVSQ